MNIQPKEYEQFEKELDLFSIQKDTIYIWERIRFNVFQEISNKNGQAQAHTQIENGLKTYLHGIILWARNVIYRNPYLAGEHNFLFFGHQRRKLQHDGYWWDIYCDPIYEQDELDYVHAEVPYLLSHRSPAKTENLRYFELIEYTGTIQRKLGLRSPTLPENTTTRLREAEVSIRDRFDVEIDLVSRVKHELHVRNTTLPLYERLLDRINPKIVVVVVSYGKETFIEACKRKNIPVIELQHGAIYDHHFGYVYPEGQTKTTFPDYFLPFGEFWKENVRFPIPDDRVVPVGYPHLEVRRDDYKDVERTEQLLFISQGTIGHKLSRFALEVHEDDRIDHEVVYKLHPGEYDRWRTEYPWLAESDIRVVDESEPTLYQLFAESTAQVGVGSTAIYEGLYFDLDTFIFNADHSDMLQSLIEDGIVSSINTVEELVTKVNSPLKLQFDREYFFKSNAIENIINVLKEIPQVNE